MKFTSPYSVEFIENALTHYAISGSQSATAREFHIERKTLRKWIKKQRPQIKQASSKSIVLVIPDMHHPFAHKDTLDFLKAVRDKYKCNKFVCLGDELDACAFSRYPKDPDGMNAGQEWKAAILALEPFYREFPDMMVCESNHTVRPWKLAYQAGLPASFLPTVAKAMNAPDGWAWKRQHIVDGVMYIHGDNGRSGQYAAVNYMKQAKQSIVIGHIHAYASVFYEGQHFAMNTGCLIDIEAYAFNYGRGNILGVNIGCGLVINGKEAYFIPMHVNSENRWIGLHS